MRMRIITVYLSVIFLASTCLACQYNVRDIGFVDLKHSVHKLYVFLSEDELVSRSELQKLLNEEFNETNVYTELVSHGTKVHKVQTPSVFPAAVLVSPQGKQLTLPLNQKGKALKENLADLSRQLIHSSIRSNIIKQASENFAVVLLIESSDTQLNKSAALTIESSLLHIKNQMAFMPKKIKSPPGMIIMEAQDVAQQKILLW